jgi:hypothetical protein
MIGTGLTASEKSAVYQSWHRLFGWVAGWAALAWQQAKHVQPVSHGFSSLDEGFSACQLGGQK